MVNLFSACRLSDDKHRSSVSSTLYNNERASYNGSIEASQASDVGSIPIARSINLVDSVALPLQRLENGANWPEFWTQVGPKNLYACLLVGLLGAKALDSVSNSTC